MTDIWPKVAERKRLEGCRCPIKPNMDYDALIALESGCRGTKAGGPGWVCEVLDFYRSHVKRVRDAAERRQERGDA